MLLLSDRHNADELAQELDAEGWSCAVGWQENDLVVNQIRDSRPVAAHIVLPWVHRVFANLKTWALGVYHGLRRHITGEPFQIGFWVGKSEAFFGVLVLARCAASQEGVLLGPELTVPHRSFSIA